MRAETAPGRLAQVERLVAVMDRLRRDCPWDAEQTHLSLLPYLVEEACEVVEAVETGTSADLREELGDLLLQVVFHARLATEEPAGFDLEAVAAGIATHRVESGRFAELAEALCGTAAVDATLGAFARPAGEGPVTVQRSAIDDLFKGGQVEGILAALDHAATADGTRAAFAAALTEIL